MLLLRLPLHPLLLSRPLLRRPGTGHYSQAYFPPLSLGQSEIIVGERAES